VLVEVIVNEVFLPPDERERGGWYKRKHEALTAAVGAVAADRLVGRLAFDIECNRSAVTFPMICHWFVRPFFSALATKCG
jgi:hypothetical protein